MKLSNSIKICGVVLVAINLTVSFCTIWLFLRIIPAIDLIVQNNVSSLEATKSMALALSVIKDESASKKNIKNFKIALNKAKENISNKEEEEVLSKIEENYKKAFLSGNALNNTVARKELRLALDDLFKINQKEIVRLKKEASNISMAGAWGLVFMALFILFITMLFLKKLEKKLLLPLEELFEVIKVRESNKFRRCKGTNLNKDIKLIFDGVNELLDERIKYEE
ncbi:MAG: hypothetical protein ACOX3T_03020 [Bdellovibrionota bacterium]